MRDTLSWLKLFKIANLAIEEKISLREYLEEILNFVEEFEDLPLKGSKVLVGLSGGPDSVSLLYLLADLRDRFNLDLEAFHLNHRIRDSARRDAEIAQAHCRSLQIPFHYREVDVPKLRRQMRGSLEEVARRVRYQHMLEVARSIGANVVALGHNADDLASTLVMNLLRGSGIKGVTSLRLLTKRDGIPIIRPLLFIRKGTLKRFLDERGVTYAIDETNADTRYTRNKIYIEVFDALREINPKLESALLRHYLNLLPVRWDVDRKLSEILREELISLPEGWMINLGVFTSLSSYLSLSLAGELVKLIPKAKQKLEFSDVVNLGEVIASGKRKTIAKGWLSEVLGTSERYLIIYKKGPELPEISLSELGGKRVPPNWELEIEVKKDPSERIGDEGLSWVLPFPPSQLVLRARRPGDTFFNGKFRRKLKKVLSEAKLPRCFRDRWPLIIHKPTRYVVWIPGISGLKQRGEEKEITVITLRGKWLSLALSLASEKSH